MEEKIKIAVQFFGHLRTFEKCAQTVKKEILSKYDCDVFMHTWSDTEHSTPTWHNEKSKKQSVNESIIKKIEKIYSPKMILVEKQTLPTTDVLIPCLHNNGGKNISAAGMNFMLKSQIKVNELRRQYASKNHINYDLVIMLRPDIYLKSGIDFNKLINQSHKIIDYPVRFCVSNALKKGSSCSFVTDIMSDVLYLATSSNMDLIVNAFKKVKFENFSKTMWTPENLITNILAREGIATLALFFFFNRDFEIIRGNTSLKEKRRKFISFKLSTEGLRLHLLRFIKQNILSLDVCLFNFFNIDFSIGNPYAKY